ncbi:hypothetical protein ACFOTA_23895 [Chitinophaga sp. GCM10012297]|uniref:TonB dependent receptor n=1 Tax=Chitinophaga chungangae TaxID=2821488 RepID=A0ABS3YMH4_9BACT|nr:hypothetical protein [Chitinophaga chungangae]MBO9155274.1 hypothetical protein [Chitinophaga chungangae]
MKIRYILGLLALPLGAFAQKDSLKQETIDIISKYQPKLRDAAKLNLTASLPSLDTARPRLGYQVPALNLYFMYQPVPIKPLALGRDTSALNLQNNFVKIGYGNYSTPLIQAGFGSGRKDKYNFGLAFNYISSKGDIENQDYSTVNVLASGTYFSPLFEINGSLGYNRNQVHYYGYDHTQYEFEKSDVNQAFNEVIAKVGLKNRPQNDWAFRFNPQAEFVVFGDSYKRMENTFVLKAPIRKQLFEDIWIKVEGLADLSTFKEDNNEQINNNLAAIHPAVEITKPGFMLHAGANPTWSNGKFYLLPDIVNESHLIRKKLILSSGWISYIDKNNFRNLANENPFINTYPAGILNTRVEEKYTGIKGTLGNHFTYNTKFGAITWHNLPLFVNDTSTADGKKFDIRNEEELKAFQLHAEVGYIQEEKFQARVSVDWYNWNDQETELKPWHMLPFKATLFAQYSFGKKFHLNANLYTLSGSYYVLRNGDFGKTKPAQDLNAGAVYNIGKNFNLWLNANNLLSYKYQRWYGYQSYGLNVVGGIMVKF